MAFTLNLTFRGLCALIPSEQLSLNGKQNISDVTVLIPEARQEVERDSQPICAHEPRITFDQADGPDITWDLDGEHIELLGDAAGTGVTIDESMADVPYMTHAAPGSGRVRPDLLQNLAASDILVASLSLSSGSLQGIEPSPFPLEFRCATDTSGIYPRRFARAVRALIPIAGDEVVLRTTPTQAEAGLQREAVLRPKPGRSSVDVTISNLCNDDEKSDSPDVDTDFILYYDLLESYDGPRRLPTRIAEQDLQSGSEVRGEATRTNFACVDVLIDRG